MDLSNVGEQMRIVWIFFIFTLYIHAQTIKDVVKKGIAYSPRIKVLVRDYEIAMKDMEIARATYRPTLDISGFMGKEKTRTPANLGASNQYTVKSIALSGKYNLFSGFKQEYLLKEKRSSVKLAENKLKEAIIQISKEIAVAYIDVLKKYKIYRKHKKNLVNYRNTLKKVAYKIQDGGGRDSDFFQTKSRMNYEEMNLITAKQAYEDARIILAKYIHEVLDIKKMREPKLNKKFVLNSLIRKTKKYNASLGNLVMQKEIATYITAQQKSNLYPVVDLEVSKNWASNQHGILGVDQSDRIGINLKYNIYSGGTDQFNIEKAKLQTLKMADSLKDAQNEIINNLKRNYSNYSMYKKKLSAINAHIRNAKKTEYLYRKEEEETGERSIIDILNIQQEYNSAEIDKIDTQYTIKQFYFEFLANTSEILDYFGIRKK